MKVKCPACREMNEWEGNPNRPFCSESCKNRDLGDWASEKYRVAVEEDDSGNPLKRGAGDED